MTNGAYLPPAQPPDVPGLRLRTLLGRGGHGEVWAADDLATGERVAVKVGAADHGGGSPLASEVALLCRIDHPHIVRLRRVAALPDGGSAMVLELAAGGSLGALVARRGVLSAGEVSTLLVPLAGALEQVHRRGLVHGDITPGNVLLAADGRPLLADLGTARVLGVAARLDQERWQTTGFVDPAGSAADPRAGDVWSLAAVAWFALTGRPPEPSPGPATDPEVATRAPALVRLLCECLSAEPVARPEPAELARRAWDAARPEPIRLVTGPAAPLSTPTSVPLSTPPGTPVTVSSPGPVGQEQWLGQAPWLGQAGPQWLSESPDDSAIGLAVTRPAAPEAVVRQSEPIDVRGGVGSRVGSALRSGLRVVTHPVVVGASALSGLVVAALVTGMVALPGDRAPFSGGRSPSGQGPSQQAGAEQARAEQARAEQNRVEQNRVEQELSTALVRIGTARATAFRTGSTRPLGSADLAGSPAERADRQLLRRLQTAGRELHGVSYTVADVRLAGAWRDGSRSVAVTAMAGTSSHRQVRISDGATVLIPAQEPRRLTITLVRSDDGWKLSSIA